MPRRWFWPGWTWRTRDRIEDWISERPMWVLLSILALLIPVWMVLCFVVSAWLIDFITSVWP